jgi:hypothetical protein
MVQTGEVVTARVTTTASPLLRRGLERAAVAASFTLVSAHLPAQVTLHAESRSRGSDAPASDAEIDIVVEADTVVVTVRQVPALSTLVKVHGLLTTLLDTRTPANE